MKEQDKERFAMSWDIYLKDEEGETVPVTLFKEGGTYPIGGENKAILNVTYNYSQEFIRALDEDKGIRCLDGKKAKDTVEDLDLAVELLGIERDVDYWKDTEGNAGYALSILLQWAKDNPEAVWEVI
jgi:hypothetical protein